MSYRAAEALQGAVNVVAPDRSFISQRATTDGAAMVVPPDIVTPHIANMHTTAAAATRRTPLRRTIIPPRDGSALPTDDGTQTTIRERSPGRVRRRPRRAVRRPGAC